MKKIYHDGPPEFKQNPTPGAMRPLKTPTIQWVPDNASKIYDYFYEAALLVEPNHGPFHTDSCTEKITQIN